MAVRPLEQIQDEAKETIDYYGPRNEQNSKMDDMAASRWGLPKGANKDFLRVSVDPAPANALGVGIKVLSAEKPNPKFIPAGPDPDDRATASKIERGLSWELRNASKRSQTKLVPDINRSSLTYGECAVYVDYLPWRLKGQVSKKRMDQILRMGQFALVPHHPNTIFPRYSPLGLESVLSSKVMKASQVIQYWGERAAELAEFMKGKGDVDVVLSDYMNYDQRGVWVTMADNVSAESKSKFEILDEEKERIFLPWAVRMTGTSLETAPELQRNPFLSTVYRANMWTTLNILKTLVNSEVLAYAAAPRGIVEGPNGDLVSVNYGDVNKPLQVPPGHKYTPIDPPNIDRALTEILDRTKGDIDAATNIQVLANLNFPAGTAFATVNAVLQTAVASLQPYKMLSEMVLADIFENMLLWIDETDGSIVSYGTGDIRTIDEQTGEVGNNSGQQYTITKEDFSPNGIYLDVALSANAPTDHQQRVATGMQLLQIGMPLARVLEDLNVSDPEQAILERYYEDMLSNEVQINMQQRNLEAQQEFQQPNLQNLQTTGPGNPAFEATQGAAYNPAAGGQSPAATVPGTGREQIQGVDANGQPIGL